MNAKSVTASKEGRGDPFGLLGARLDGRYEIEAVVAQGGFGVVYRALHRELRKPVAIKVLKTPTELTPRQQADFLKRFAEEARTVAQLDHAHVVRVLDFGTSIMPSGAKAPWMALEWLEGDTLESDFNARIESGRGGRSAAETMALMYPVIEAVGLAHEEGIVHRDIKPGNLMIVPGRRGGARLKLLDFGIAKVMAPEEKRAADRVQTLTQVQAFSPDYAAPEQVSGMRTGPWTDVHALALVLYEMLTATVPFEGADAMEMCANVLSPDRPTPGRRGVDVGPWEQVLARALALKPSDRYNNAGELLTALMSELPPGIDPLAAELWMSQTSGHRLTPTQGLGPRPSQQPGPTSADDPSPSNPTSAEGMTPLRPPAAGQLASTLRPPASADDLGRAPTLLALSSSVPRPARSGKPTPTMELGPPRASGPAPAERPIEVPFTLGDTEPPPRPVSEPRPPPYDPALPTEPPPRERAYVAPMLVLIGLFFGGLVSTAIVLLLRADPAPARRPALAPPPVASPPVARRAVVDAAAPALDAAVALDATVTLDAGAPADAGLPVDAVVATVDAASAEEEEEAPRGRHRHGHHRHESRSHHSHRHHHDDEGDEEPVPAE